MRYNLRIINQIHLKGKIQWVLTVYVPWKPQQSRCRVLPSHPGCFLSLSIRVLVVIPKSTTLLPWWKKSQGESLMPPLKRPLKTNSSDWYPQNPVTSHHSCRPFCGQSHPSLTLSTSTVSLCTTCSCCCSSKSLFLNQGARVILLYHFFFRFYIEVISYDIYLCGTCFT